MARVTKLVGERSLLLLPRLGLHDLGGNKDAGLAFTFKLAGYGREDGCLADFLVERLGHVIILEQDNAGGFLAVLGLARNFQCGLASLGFLERAFCAFQVGLDCAYGVGVAFLLDSSRRVSF